MRASHHKVQSQALGGVKTHHWTVELCSVQLWLTFYFTVQTEKDPLPTCEVFHLGRSEWNCCASKSQSRLSFTFGQNGCSCKIRVNSVLILEQEDWCSMRPLYKFNIKVKREHLLQLPPQHPPSLRSSHRRKVVPSGPDSAKVWLFQHLVSIQAATGGPLLRFLTGTEWMRLSVRSLDPTLWTEQPVQTALWHLNSNMSGHQYKCCGDFLRKWNTGPHMEVGAKDPSTVGRNKVDYALKLNTNVAFVHKYVPQQS